MKARRLTKHSATYGLLFSSACDEWRLLPKPDLHRDVNRFGHSAVVSNGWVFLLLFVSHIKHTGQVFPTLKASIKLQSSVFWPSQDCLEMTKLKKHCETASYFPLLEKQVFIAMIQKPNPLIFYYIATFQTQSSHHLTCLVVIMTVLHVFAFAECFFSVLRILWS